MIHARPDYNRIQDPAVEDRSLLAPGCEPIGADEPVFILRAKDISAPATLSQWAFIHQRNGGSSEMASLAVQHAARMEEWQRTHGAKVATMPGEPTIDWPAHREPGAVR